MYIILHQRQCWEHSSQCGLLRGVCCVTSEGVQSEDTRGSLGTALLRCIRLHIYFTVYFPTLYLVCVVRKNVALPVSSDGRHGGNGCTRQSGPQGGILSVQSCSAIALPNQCLHKYVTFPHVTCRHCHVTTLWFVNCDVNVTVQRVSNLHHVQEYSAGGKTYRWN